MLEQIKEKMKNGHVRYITTAVAVVALVALILFLKNEADHKTYTSYTVELQKEKTENASKYEYVNGSILRYSIDGASLLRKDLEAAWTVGFSMMDPRLDLCGTHILIYDRLGTQAVILDMKGQVSSFSALGPILTARISARDTVAMLVQDGDKVDFIYYSGTGEQIASGESSMSDPGYPLALAVSDDGTDVAISYLSAAEGSISSIVRFYNFGTKGKGQVNNMTGEDAFEGVIAPDIDYLNGNECVVFRDNGFTVYKGQNGTAYRSVDFDHEIVSAFHDGSHMGFVFDSEDKEHRFDMQIYDKREPGFILLRGPDLQARPCLRRLGNLQQQCGVQPVQYEGLLQIQRHPAGRRRGRCSSDREGADICADGLFHGSFENGVTI